MRISGRINSVFFTAVILFLIISSAAAQQHATLPLLAFDNALVPDDSAGTIQEPAQRVSAGRAFWLSALIPGAGEYYAGDKKMAGIFFGLEALLWGIEIFFQTHAHWKENDYHQFAAAHAGVDPVGKDRDYYVTIEDFNNIRAYNDEMLQLRDLESMYPENTAYDWQWDSENNREKYETMRIASDRSYDRARMTVLAILLNHLASGVDAIRVTRAQNRKIASNPLRFGFSALPEGGGVVHVWKMF